MKYRIIMLAAIAAIGTSCLKDTVQELTPEQDALMGFFL